MVHTLCAMHDELTNLIGLSVRLRLPSEWLAGEDRAGRIPYLQVGRQRLFNVGAVRKAIATRAAACTGESHGFFLESNGDESKCQHK